MLLHASTLHPAGPSKLAAIRFGAPVRVTRVRIFPHGEPLFSQEPELTSQTEPNLILLDVYFTAQPLPNSNEPKPKASNGLVPTSIAYAGGLTDYPLDMGEYSTRLMIIKGDFQALTIAVYGQVISEPEQLTTYAPRELPLSISTQLSKSLDPASMKDPTLLARQLLAEIPHAPSFLHLIRLMFCLKPGDDEWDNPNFPHVYADLVSCIESYEASLEWLEGAAQALSTPASDNLAEDLLRDFADRLKDALDSKGSEQLVLLSKLLERCTCQPASLTTTILDAFDTVILFEDPHAGLVTVLRNLCEAAANPTIARHLLDHSRLDTLLALQDSDTLSPETKTAASDLVTRLNGWQAFEKGVDDPEVDFSICGPWILDLAAHETTFGTFLLALMADPLIAPKLANKAVDIAPPLLWNSNASEVSFDERIAFLKAYTGVSAVFAVLSWADSEGKKASVESITALVRLWQDVPIYCDIVNLILLLPQMIWRLECMIDADPPSRSTLHAEQILCRVVVASPSALLRDRLAHSIATCATLLSVPEHERLALVRLGDLARGGLSRALRTVLDAAEKPSSEDDMTEVRLVQVALRIIEATLKEEDGVRKVMMAVWEQDTQGLVPALIDMFARISRHFSIHSSPTTYPQTRSKHDLKCTAETLESFLKVLTVFIPSSRLPMRTVRALTQGLLDTYIVLSSPSCRDILTVVTDTTSPDGFGQRSAQTMLQTLLQEANTSPGDDPVQRLSKIHELVLIILPTTSEDRVQERAWSRILSNVLGDVHRFLRALEPKERSSFLLKLVNTDQNELGIGEWLLSKDIKDLHQSVTRLAVDPDRRLPVRHQVISTSAYILDLIKRQSTSTPWVIPFLVSNGSATRLGEIMAECLRHAISGPTLSELSLQLVNHANQTLRLPLARQLLHGACTQPRLLPAAHRLIHKLSHLTDTQEQTLSAEIGLSLSAVAKDVRGTSHWGHAKPVAESILALLELLGARDPPLANFTEPSFDNLYDFIAKVLPTSRTEGLPLLRTQLQFSDDEPMLDEVAADEGIHGVVLSAQELSSLMQHKKASTPVTPRNIPQDIISLVALSPPTALLRSPPVSTLTKQYKDNDFRQLRTVPSARLNTSRPPSMHVDDYEQGSPLLAPTPLLMVHPAPTLPAFASSPPMLFSSFPSQPQF